jgi:hypothetical protein
VFGQSPAVFRRVEAGLTFRRRPKPPQTRPKPDLWRPPKTPGGFESRSPPFYLRQIAPFLLHRGRTFLKGQTNVGVVTITWQDLGLLLRYVDVREGWPFDAPRPVMLSDEERLTVLFALARLNEDEVTPTLSLPTGHARRRVSLVSWLGG